MTVDNCNGTLLFLAFSTVDGNYTDWTEWTVCDKTCGPGLMARWRACSNPAPQYGGRDCSSFGSDTETKSCQIKDYCPSKLEYLVLFVQSDLVISASDQKECPRVVLESTKI